MNILDLLYLVLGVLSAPFWARKQRGGWDQRFGHVRAMLSDRDPEDGIRVMIHAVSVGEVNATRALIEQLCEDHNVGRVIVSTTTDTGLRRAQELFSDRCEVVRYPIDCSWMVRRFLDAVRPDVVGLVELEVWPNFVKIATKRAIPICVINGRLSERSFNGYRKIRFLLRSTFARLTIACVQDESYAERFRAMGVADDRVRVTDSMKWDSVDADRPLGEISTQAHELARALGVDLNRPVVVAGSTGPGEEALIHHACPDDVQLICAPRKVERFCEAGDAMPGCVRRSAGNPGSAGENRFLLDSIGELSALYEVADVVIIGRSFCDLFGSDPIEPAALGKPVIIGPNHSDFSSAIGALIADGAIVISSRDSLSSDLGALLNDQERRHRIGEHGRACVRAHQGATGRHRGVLVELGAGA